MSRTKRYTRADMDQAIGNAYASGARDGAAGDRPYRHGSWLSESARVVADKAVDAVFDDKASTRARIAAEYDKHVPELRPEAIELGNNIYASTNVFKCAAEGCYHAWPCPNWQMLRHLHGWDDATYTITVDRKDEPGEPA